MRYPLGMIVPYENLSSEALAGVIEEYVTRDGTDSTDAAVKIADVRGALQRGELVIVFDSESETCNLLSPEDMRARLENCAGDEP